MGDLHQKMLPMGPGSWVLSSTPDTQQLQKKDENVLIGSVVGAELEDATQIPGATFVRQSDLQEGWKSRSDSPAWEGNERHWGKRG